MRPLTSDVIKTFKIEKETFIKYWKENEYPLCRGEIEEKQLWENLVKRTKSKVSVPNESLLLREYTKNFHIDKEVLNIIKELKNKGIKLAVLTNTIKQHTEYNKKMGLYDEFGVKIFSNEIGITKPDKEVYWLCLDELHVKPEETFFVDDRETYLTPAQEIGIYSILYKNPQQLRARFVEMGVLER